MLRNQTEWLGCIIVGLLALLVVVKVLFSVLRWWFGIVGFPIDRQCEIAASLGERCDNPKKSYDEETFATIPDCKACGDGWRRPDGMIDSDPCPSCGKRWHADRRQEYSRQVPGTVDWDSPDPIERPGEPRRELSLTVTNADISRRCEQRERTQDVLAACRVAGKALRPCGILKAANVNERRNEPCPSCGGYATVHLAGKTWACDYTGCGTTFTVGETEPAPVGTHQRSARVAPPAGLSDWCPVHGNDGHQWEPAPGRDPGELFCKCGAVE